MKQLAFAWPQAVQKPLALSFQVQALALPDCSSGHRHSLVGLSCRLMNPQACRSMWECTRNVNFAIGKYTAGGERLQNLGVEGFPKSTG